MYTQNKTAINLMIELGKKNFSKINSAIRNFE